MVVVVAMSHGYFHSTIRNRLRGHLLGRVNVLTGYTFCVIACSLQLFFPVSLPSFIYLQAFPNTVQWLM